MGKLIGARNSTLNLNLNVKRRQTNDSAAGILMSETRRPHDFRKPREKKTNRRQPQ